MRDSFRNIRIEDAKEVFKNHPKLLLSPLVSNAKEKIRLLDRIVDLTSQSKISDDQKREMIKKVESIRLKIAQLSNKIMEGNVTKSEQEELNTLLKGGTQ